MIRRPPEDRIDPGHESTRVVLRLIGPLMVIGGGLLVLSFVVQFFGNFGSGAHSMPSIGGAFGRFMLGGLLLSTGMAISRYAFMGAVARYTAGEIAPVASDTFKAVVEESGPVIQTVTRAVAGGLREDAPTASDATSCPVCHNFNEPTARFCDQCGQALTLACPGCGHVGDARARFCADCGAMLK